MKVKTVTLEYLRDNEPPVEVPEGRVVVHNGIARGMDGRSGFHAWTEAKPEDIGGLVECECDWWDGVHFIPRGWHDILNAAARSAN